MVLSVLRSENRPALATAFVFVLLAPGGLDVITKRCFRFSERLLLSLVATDFQFYIFVNNSVFITLKQLVAVKKRQGDNGVLTATECSVA